MEALDLHISPRLWGPLAGFAGLMVLLAVVGKVPVSYNLRNLLVRWPTTILIAVTFTAVVALFVGMLAFVNGMYKLTQGSGVPGNVLVMSEGSTDELFSNLGFRDTADVDRQPLVLRDEYGNPLSSRETYVAVNQPIPATAGGSRQRRFVSLRGVDDPAMSGRVHALELHPGGQWFAVAGVQDAPNPPDEAGPRQLIQAVLGEGIAREFGQDVGKATLAVGDVFELGPRRWVVTGIMKSGGSAFDSEVWAKRQLAGPMFGKENLTTIVVRTAGPKEAAELAEDLKKNFKKAALSAQVETEYYIKLQETGKQFLVAIVVVAVVMGVGGVFGVMNTMFAAISARIRDIGVLRILGFARWQVLVSFFLEALLLAALGGALGCLIGYQVHGVKASSIASAGPGSGMKTILLELTVDAQVLSAGMLFTLVMGAVGGLLPALSAMRLKPLDSLR